MPEVLADKKDTRHMSGKLYPDSELGCECK